MEDLARLRGDLVPFLLGALLLALGLGALAASLVRRARGDSLLVSFAAFAGLYGLRLAAGTSWSELVLGLDRRLSGHLEWLVTYWVGIPALVFFMGVLGARLRRVFAVMLVPLLFYAVAASLADLALGIPGAASAPNNALVIASQAAALVAIFGPGAPTGPEARVLRWSYSFLMVFVLNENLSGLVGAPFVRGVEVVGFLGFLAGLGYVAVRRALQNEQRLATLAQELETARRIQASILPTRVPPDVGLRLVARYEPMSAVAGDFWDFAEVPGGLGLLVADVSGHGVPAALVASMVKVAFETQQPRAQDPAALLAGMNAALCRVLDGPFVTAVYACLSPATGRLRVGGAGHPPALLWRAAQGRVESLAENGLLMGFDAVAPYAARETSLGTGDRLLLFTDGVIEAADARDEQFGLARLEELLASAAHLDLEALADRVLAELRQFRGAATFEDDLTLVVVEVLAGVAGERA